MPTSSSEKNPVARTSRPTASPVLRPNLLAEKEGQFPIIFRHGVHLPETGNRPRRRDRIPPRGNWELFPSVIIRWRVKGHPGTVRPARRVAAEKPASGERQGFAFTSRIQGRPSLSTRKSTRAYPRRSKRFQHRRASSFSFAMRGASCAGNSNVRGVFANSNVPSSHFER